MGLSVGVLGFGTQWQLGDGATPTENFTNIMEPHDIAGIGSEFPLVNSTHQQSPNFYEEFLPGLLDNNEFTVTCVLVPSHATHNSTTGLRGQVINRQRKNHRLIFPFSPAVQLDFAALVRGVPLDANMRELMVINPAVKPVGPIVATNW